FSAEESRVIERIREEICRDASFIPRNPGDDYPFTSFFAAYLLSPREPAAGLTWVYATREALRRSVHFTTVRIPLDQASPFAVARSIVDGQLKGSIHHAIHDKSFLVEIPDAPGMSPVAIDPEARFGVGLRELAWMPESRLLEKSPSVFRPFITFQPGDKAAAEDRNKGSLEKVPSAPPATSQMAERPSVLPQPNREAEYAARKKQPNGPFLSRRLPMTMMAVIVSMSLGFLLGRTLGQREAAPPADDPATKKDANGEEETEAPILLSGSNSSSKVLLLPNGRPRWMYGGERKPAGAPDPRAPAPAKEELKLDGSLVRSGDGKPIWELRQGFFSYNEQGLDRQGKKSGEIFVVLREEIRSTQPKSGIPGNQPVWLEVQFLKIPRLSGDTIDLTDEFADNSLGWPTDFYASRMSWIRDEQYTIASSVRTCQIRMPGRALPRPGEPVSIAVQGVWLSGHRDSDFGLALVRGNSSPEEFVLFSTTAGGHVRVRERRKDGEQTIANTRLGSGGGQEVELRLDFMPGGVSFKVDGREVFAGTMDTAGLSRLGLLTCGGQAVGFRRFSIQSRDLTNASREHSTDG
ncbi:MAG TPA: hypothetical protein VKM72_08625, partial [Thermoanaerobaculia bacterium]|nr:hypothetical protein [Thermoanaerobaculia bacterium]